MSASQSELDAAFLRRAIELSVANVAAGGGPFGAVIVRDAAVIGEGSNRVTSSNDPTAHAEVEAIRAACRAASKFTLAGATIYASCEPCPMCLSAIYWARIDRIVFGGTRADAAAIDFDDDFIYRELALPAVERAIPATQLLRDEAITAFRKWREKADRVAY
ncbi:MAG: nucleoside deaminase [Phycisphaerales bacterium]|nr:nucleoside deaminase [Phycisphaerales bacterium]